MHDLISPSQRAQGSGFSFTTRTRRTDRWHGVLLPLSSLIGSREVGSLVHVSSSGPGEESLNDSQDQIQLCPIPKPRVLPCWNGCSRQRSLQDGAGYEACSSLRTSSKILLQVHHGGFWSYVPITYSMAANNLYFLELTKIKIPTKWTLLY